MALSTPLLVWPTEPSTLRHLLGLDSTPQLCCHGRTQKAERCSVGVSKDNSTLVSSLLVQVVKKGSFEAARSLLGMVSCLVMCQRHHQNQGPSWMTSWEKKLGLYKTPIIKVKKQDEDEDIKSLLARLPEMGTESRKKDLVSSSQQTVVKDETSTQRESVKKEEVVEDKSLSTASIPTPTLSKPTLSKPTPSKPTLSKDIVTQHTFEPYSKSLCIRAINQRIKDLILRPLTKKENRDGFIYIYTFPDNYRDPTPYLKIGCTVNLEARMTEWRRKCGYKPKEIANYPAEKYLRAEKLVHAALRNQRKRETGCPTCGIKHNEWFAVRGPKASGTVSLWTTWMRLQPYGEDGVLKKEWAEKVEGVDLSDRNCWGEFVHGRQEEDDDDDDDGEVNLSGSDESYCPDLNAADDDDE